MSLKELSEKITLALALQGGEIPRIVSPIVTPNGIFLPSLQTPPPEGYKYVPCTVVVKSPLLSEMTIAGKFYSTEDYQWLRVEHGIEENDNDNSDSYLISLGGVFLAPQHWEEPEQDGEKVCLFSDDTSQIFVFHDEI